MATQGCGPALLDMAGNPVLICAYSVLNKELLEVAVEDLGHLRPLFSRNIMNFRF
jgi:hypothetical protein